MNQPFTKISQLKTADQLRQYLQEKDLDLPVDDRILTASEQSPLARTLRIGPMEAGNRWAIHPMEGWDASPDGSPSELTLRRWENFGRSGAKLIWGGEAVAVQQDGRANPRQLLATPQNKSGLANLLHRLTKTHQECFGRTDDLVVGLQLTHSGRFSRPNSHRLEPRIAFHHPLLDPRCRIDPTDNRVVWTDSQLQRLIDQYVKAAGLARDVGFSFVDVKACHGYLLHETLSARTRPGPYGGDFEGRTRLLKTIVRRIREEWPDLLIGVRLSVFDSVPFHPARQAGRPDDGVGQPDRFKHLLPYQFGFGIDPIDPLQQDLSEPIRLIKELHGLGVVALNATSGSPYYNPHMQRPAMFPPSDGYLPPEDPLVGVTRMISAARQCKEAVPEMPMIGTGYTYLQDYLPHVAQAVVREGWIDAVGIGRMVLAYPECPADCLQHGTLQRKRICRTFSDCTTAPRKGLVSGCYPLDAYYKSLPESTALKKIKQAKSKNTKRLP